MTAIKRLSFLLFIIAFPLISNSAETTPKPVHISADEIHKMIEDKAAFVLIDARWSKMYDEGHLPGAISLPADEVNAKTLGEIAPNMDEKLIFYCAGVSCPASRIGAAKAIGAGYKYVYEFSGGVDEWIESDYEMEIIKEE